MQKELKNTLQDLLGVWQKKGQARWEDLTQQMKSEWASTLAEKGLAQRWAALLSVVEEVAPPWVPALAEIVSHQQSPLAKWLNLKVINWDAYRIGAELEPQDYLLISDSWMGSLPSAAGELMARWLLEKHTPPGSLKIDSLKCETEYFGALTGKLILRTELDPKEWEETIGNLKSRSQSEIFMTVLLVDSSETLKGRLQFHFDLKWKALLK